MFKSPCKVAVITPTFRREKEMVSCILQVKRQQTNFPFRHIVVCDGHNRLTERLCQYYGVVCVTIPKEKGVGQSLGHLPRDVGGMVADSVYVCYWDDDNVYFDNALQTLHDTVEGYDIGVCRIQYFAHSNGNIMQEIPTQWSGDIKAGDIDTMNMIFRREMALKERWTQFKKYNGDFLWAKKLQREHKGSLVYNPTVIGIHV